MTRLLSRFRRKQPRSEEPAILFHHIPKCGGTSLVETLYRWFSILHDYESKFASREEFLSHPVSRTALSAELLLAGHWNEPGKYLRDRYPEFLEDPGLFRFCFLRDPLEVRLSLYRYNRSRPDCNEPARRLELEEFLFARPNYLSKQFPCDEKNVDQCLARYQFIGLVEAFDSDLAALLNAYGAFLRTRQRTRMSERMLCNLRNRPPAPVGHVNRSRESGEPELVPALVEKFREVHALDYELLRIARTRRSAQQAA